MLLPKGVLVTFELLHEMRYLPEDELVALIDRMLESAPGSVWTSDMPLPDLGIM